MSTQNSDIRYRLIGQDVSAGSTFKKVAGEAQAAHGAISTLGNSLNSAGAFTPLQQGLSAIGQAFQHIQENGKRTAVVMQGIGLGIAGVGAALLAVGGKEQQATAGLKASVEATGAIFGDYKARIEDAIATQERFGHSANDTEDALSRLTQATNDPAAALRLMGLAANVAAARNISLNDAATTLAQGLAGNTRAFRQFGITLDGVGSKADQISRAFDSLNQKLSGQAQAKADTFTGHIKAMGVQLEDTVSSLAKFAPLLLTVGSGLTVVSAATDYLNRKRAQEALSADAAATSETRLATATRASGDAALTTGTETTSSGLLAGRLGLSGGALLRGGGFAIGGLLAGQLLHAGVGGRAGSTLGDAATGAGVGAGIGSIVPVIGTGVGAGVGALAGGLLGFLHHSSAASAAEQQLNLQEVLDSLGAQKRAQEAAALAAQFQSYLPSEFDQLGNPKAKAVATATEALSKAKTSLARAQEDLNKQESKAADPLKLAAASARLTAAQESLRKAEYSGRGVAAAQAAVDSAQATLHGLHTGTDTTSGQRRVTDAQRAVNDARRRVRQARGAAQPLGIGALLHRQQGNLHTITQDVHAQRTLVNEGLDRQVIEEIDALNKTVPGTIESIAKSLTPHIAAVLDANAAKIAAAKKKFADIGQRAAEAQARSNGQRLADAYAQGALGKLRRLGLDADLRHIASPTPPLPVQFGGTTTPGSTLVPGQYGIHIQNMTVQANDPKKLARDLANNARHRALSAPGEQRYGFGP